LSVNVNPFWAVSGQFPALDPGSGYDPAVALEEELVLDFTQALQDIGTVEDALTQIAENFKAAMEEALSALEIPPIDVPVNDDQVVALEQQLDQLEGSVTVTTENPNEPAQEVQSAFESTPFVVTPEIDTEALTQSLDDAFAQAESSSEGLSGLGEGLENAQAGFSSAAGGALEFQGALSLVRESSGAVARDSGALLGIADKLGGKFLPLTAAFTAFGLAGRTFVSSARSSVSASERFSFILGDMAEEVDNIDIGGLNEDLTTLAQRLGQDDEALRNAASKIFQIGKTSGIARPEVADLTETVVALAARAGALDPTLTNVGASAQRLFFGLARGGPILARFGIDLPAKELREFAEQSGKTFASLSIGERATIGAELALKKLGGTLASDINQGAENTEIRFRALREEFNNAVEDLGVPLLEPTLAAIRAGQPLLLELANLFSSLISAVAPLGALLIESVTPAVEGLAGALSLLLSPLGPLSEIIGSLPSELVTLATTFGVVALAVNRYTAAAKGAVAVDAVSGVAPTASRLQRAAAGLDVSAARIGIAVAGITTAFVVASKIWEASIAKGEEAVSSFTQDIEEKFPAAGTTVAELRRGIQQIGKAEDDLRKSRRGSSSLFDIDYRRDLQKGEEALQDLTAEYTEQIAEANRLSSATGVNADTLLKLIRAGEDTAPVIARVTDEYGRFFQSIQDKALDDLIRQQERGTLTAEEFAKGAEDTGKSTKELDAILKSAADATEQFVAGFGGPTPSIIDTAIGKIDDATLSLKAFQDQIRKEGLAQISFQQNLETILQAGAFGAFEALQRLGPERGAQIAQEAVARGNEGIAELERIVAQASTIEAQGEAQRRRAAEAARRRADLTEQVKVEFNLDLTKFNEQERQFIDRIVSEDTGGLFGTAIGTNATDALQRNLEESDTKNQAIFEAVGLNAGQAFVEGFRENSSDIAGETGFITEADRVLAEDQAGALGELVALGFQSGIETGGATIASRVRATLVDPVLNLIINTFKIGSPSKLMEEFGKEIVAGFNVGLEDTVNAAELVDDVLTQMERLSLGAQDLANVAGSSFDELTATIEALGKAREEAANTPQAFEDIVKSVEALGGPEGVKKLQEAMAMTVATAFKGATAEQIQELVDQQRLQQAVQAVSASVGVAPILHPPGTELSVFGRDAAVDSRLLTGTGAQVIIEHLEVTPPEDASMPEVAAAIGDQVTWALRSVTV